MFRRIWNCYAEISIPVKFQRGFSCTFNLAMLEVNQIVKNSRQINPKDKSHQNWPFSWGRRQDLCQCNECIAQVLPPIETDFKPLRLFLIHCYKWLLATSDHQCSEKINFLSGFTLRMWNYVSSSWFERLRISDRKFVNHTAEMILWSMILNISQLKEHIWLLFLIPYHWDMILVSGILPVIYL